MIVNIDLNCTLMDQIGFICELSGGKLCRADFDRWDPPLGHKVGMTEKEFVKWAWCNEGLQVDSPPHRGAAIVLHMLKKWGHTINIVTSTITTPSKVVAWLDKWSIPFDEIIFTKDKAAVPGDLFIDDSPDVIDQLQRAGRQVIKFHVPWNRDKQCPRIDTWNCSKILEIIGR